MCAWLPISPFTKIMSILTFPPQQFRRALWEAVSWARAHVLLQIKFNSQPPHCVFFSQLTLSRLQSEVMSPLASSSPIMFCLPHSSGKKKKKPIFPTSNPNKGRQHEQKNPVVPKWLYCDNLESKGVGAETQQCNPVRLPLKREWWLCSGN